MHTCGNGLNDLINILIFDYLKWLKRKRILGIEGS